MYIKLSTNVLKSLKYLYICLRRFQTIANKKERLIGYKSFIFAVQRQYLHRSESFLEYL